MKISVCIATYNGEKFIEEQLHSIFAQTVQVDEIILSDDSSTDKTIEIIKKFKSEKIKLFADNKFRSAILNFENSIKLSTGDIIFLSDQDDIWDPKKVEKMTSQLLMYDLVVSNCNFIDENGCAILNRGNFFQWRNSKKGILKNILKNSYIGCCMAFNKKIIQKALPFPKDIPMHDMWIGLIANLFFKVKFIDDCLLKYRRHNNNTTVLTKEFESPFSLRTKIRYRFIIVKNLLYKFLG